MINDHSRMVYRSDAAYHPYFARNVYRSDAGHITHFAMVCCKAELS